MLHFVDALTATSAAAAVIAHSLQLTFDGAAQIGVPGLILPTCGVARRNSPQSRLSMAPVSAGAVLDPYKIGVGLVLTNEID